MEKNNQLVLWFNDIRKEDVPVVGGKSANLGEMVSSVEVPVPLGFATTTAAYNLFLDKNGIRDKINKRVQGIDVENEEELKGASKDVKALIMAAEIPKELASAILSNFEQLKTKENAEFVAVRSSATAEDLPNASFAGQQDTYLNVDEKNLLEKVKECYASLFTARAIYYRAKNRIDTKTVSLSVAIQKQVFSAAAGVMFTLDVSSGDRTVIVIESSYGLGEYIVGGIVTPDLFYVDKKSMSIKKRTIEKKEVALMRLKEGGSKEVKISADQADKPSLSDKEVLELASYGMKIEEHYKRPMDIEWAKNEDGKIYIVQARPETVWSREKPEEKSSEELGKVLITGLPASPGFTAGKAHVILDVKDIDDFKAGEILVTKMTTPDWVPAMKKAIAIVTDEGGITSHAAIVSREMGVPCIVGTGGSGKFATEVIKNGETITVDSKNGMVYGGEIKREEKETPATASTIIQGAPIITGTKILVNLGEPELAEKVSKLPADGVGLMREEFIWASIGQHPLYMIKEGKSDALVDKLSEGIKTVCAAFNPRPVIMRFSDFKSDEYAHLKGGEEFEPKESNPLLGWRGASRYYDPKYKEAFVLEVKAVKKVREELGMKNLFVMFPFTRTVDELQKVLAILKENGLERSEDFKIFLMAEIPSDIILADQFNQYIDGYSIGSNDLTMLIMGADRNNDIISKVYDERNLAVLRMVRYLIKIAHRDGKTVSICGQAPSEYDDFVDFLVRSDIDDISVNPDSVEHVRELVASVEKRIELEKSLGEKTAKNKSWDFPLH